ncbi:MAG: dTDP-glucose 4,6-dehydratase [Christensenellales bacterium]|jgi:dTDP-glucose 4,6-dehydratase
MTILVTGGAGFIGSSFLWHILEQYPDDRVVCVDALTYAANPATVDAMREHPRFQFVRADICDGSAMREAFEQARPDAVVNFAAQTHVDRSIDDPAVFVKTNVLGTQTLLDACRAFGVSRFHQVSTDEVYGDLPLDRPDLLFTEDTPIRTSSPYSASKAGADLLVLAYHRTYGMHATISRCSNNYGARQFPEKLIPLTILRLLADQPVPVYGDGRNVRDWLYVDDHCHAIDMILRRGKAGEVYNVGGHNEMRNIDIVRLICSHLNKPEHLITFVEDRKGHDLRYAIDPSKIHAALGWLPETRFAEGIAHTIDWYLGNRGWWEPLLEASGA